MRALGCSAVCGDEPLLVPVRDNNASDSHTLIAGKGRATFGISRRLHRTSPTLSSLVAERAHALLDEPEPRDDAGIGGHEAGDDMDMRAARIGVCAPDGLTSHARNPCPDVVVAKRPCRA